MTKIRRAGIFVVTMAVIAALTSGIATADDVSTVWLCKPGATPNPCEGSQATTDAGTGSIESAPAASEPPIDCFYVYPTVSLQLGANANDVPGIEQQVVAQQQAQRFSPHCRIFAPVYRQSTLIGLAASPGDARSAALDIAYGDIERAWDQYMTRYNNGRGVVLIGHSQGTYMLRALLRQHIDPVPEVKARIVSALLLGGNVLVKRGQKVGGDFENLPACTSAAEIGCVVAFSTFNAVPPADASFGRAPTSDAYGAGLDLPSGPDYEVLCTNPASLAANDRSSIQPIFRSLVELAGSPPIVFDANAVAASTPFVIPAEKYTARCESDGDAQVLRIEGGNADVLHALPTARWGLHFQDVNIALGDLTDIVDRQTQTYLVGH